MGAESWRLEPDGSLALGLPATDPATHRENQPPLDLAPYEARCKERRGYTAAIRNDTIDADTEMMERLVTELKRVRLSNESLREVIKGLGVRPMPVAP